MFSHTEMKTYSYIVGKPVFATSLSNSSSVTCPLIIFFCPSTFTKITVPGKSKTSIHRNGHFKLTFKNLSVLTFYSKALPNFCFEHKLEISNEHIKAPFTWEPFETEPYHNRYG